MSSNIEHTFKSKSLLEKFSALTRSESEMIRKNAKMGRDINALLNGREPTRRSWEYENIKDPFEVLRRWDKMSKLSLNSYQYQKEVWAFDLGKSNSRLVPQGGTPGIYSKQAEDVLKPVFDSSPYDNELALQPYFKYTDTFAKYLLGKNSHGQLVPSTPQSVIQSLDEHDKLITNSGYPRYERRKFVVNAEISDAVSGRCFKYPAIILFRFYRGRLRAVWMYPMSRNIKEAQFEQPLINAIRNSENPLVRQWTAPWVGFDNTKLTLYHQFLKGKTLIGGDTHQMDANMRPAQLRLVFEILKHIFNAKYSDLLYEVLMQVNTIHGPCSAVHPARRCRRLRPHPTFRSGAHNRYGHP